MPRFGRAFPAALGLGVVLACPHGGLRADEPFRLLFDASAAREADSVVPGRPNWIRLFSIQPAFLCDPVGLDADDPPDQAADSGPGWLQVALGNDNPFFDI